MVQFREKKVTCDFSLHSLSQYGACSDILRSLKISFSRFIHAIWKKKKGQTNIRKKNTASQ